jgi:hypothetical protein
VDDESHVLNDDGTHSLGVNDAVFFRICLDLDGCKLGNRHIGFFRSKFKLRR